MSERSVIFCTGGFDHSVKFWEAPAGTCIATIPFNESQINSLSITSDKSYLGVAGNPLIKIFDTHNSTPKSLPLLTFEGQNGHTSNVCCIGFQKEKKWLYSCSEDGSAKIWDLRQSTQPTRTCQNLNKTAINTAILHPNQAEIITGDENGIIRIWDLTSNTCSQEIIPESNIPIRSISISQNAQILTAVNNNGNCYLWKLRNATHSTIIQNSEQQSIQNNNNENFPPSSNFTNYPNIESFLTIEAHPGQYVLKCLISPDSNYLCTCSSDKTIKLWNLLIDQNNNNNNINCSLYRTFVGHSAWVWDIAFSADSAYLVSGSSDKTAKLWDCKTGEICIEYKGHNKAITAVALNDSS